MSWVTAGTENGRSLQYKITDCCIEKRIIDQHGNVERETVEHLKDTRHRDSARSFVNDIPRMYSPRPARHSSIRGGRFSQKELSAMRRALQKARSKGYRDYSTRTKRMLRSALRRKH